MDNYWKKNLKIMLFFAVITQLIILICRVSAVTQDEIDAQKAVVQSEQSRLDSLESLALADRLDSTLIDVDSTLTANNVQILVDAKPFDPLYVQIDVPYSKWSSLVQKLWDAERKLNAPKHIETATGRYAVRKDRVKAFLATLRTFLQGL